MKLQNDDNLNLLALAIIESEVDEANNEIGDRAAIPFIFDIGAIGRAPDVWDLIETAIDIGAEAQKTGNREMGLELFIVDPPDTDYRFLFHGTKEGIQKILIDILLAHVIKDLDLALTDPTKSIRDAAFLIKTLK